MSRAKITDIAIAALASLSVLCPLAARSQQMAAAPAEDVGSGFAMSAPNARALAQTLTPSAPNSFQRPASSGWNRPDDGKSAESLQWQRDRSRISALALYDFTAPPSFYASSHNQLTASDWNSVASGAITGYLTRYYTTYIRATGEFQLDGEKRESGANGQPGTQTFTTQWESAHLLPSRLGLAEVAAGVYRQQLVSYGSFANSAIADEFAGSSISAHGLETTLTVPDKNLTLSVHHGTQYLGRTLGKAHLTMFELSWTW